jgi:hypothetical protein
LNGLDNRSQEVDNINVEDEVEGDIEDVEKRG